tara:strand:+ start:2001 stop:2276 length:276 start_codon:yes stop_codon:yes gene_type:complete
MEAKLITYTTNELKMCENIARASHPSEYKDIYKHITLCTKPYGDLHPEVWINKMTAKTTSMWEQNHPDLQASDMIEDILYDSGIKHMNFRS